MGSLSLTLIISGLTLHASLFIEILLHWVVLTKLDKNANPVKNIVLINSISLLYVLFYIIFLHQTFMNIFNMINCNSIIINTKITSITSKPIFFHII